VDRRAEAAAVKAIAFCATGGAFGLGYKYRPPRFAHWRGSHGIADRAVLIRPRNVRTAVMKNFGTGEGA
jgi:hypothetical protein